MKNGSRLLSGVMLRKLVLLLAIIAAIPILIAMLAHLMPVFIIGGVLLALYSLVLRPRRR